MLYARRVGLAEKPKALKETMLPIKRKKSITISHTQQKRKNEDVKIRGDQYQGQGKVNKVNKIKLIKFNLKIYQMTIKLIQ